MLVLQFLGALAGFAGALKVTLPLCFADVDEMEEAADVYFAYRRSLNHTYFPDEYDPRPTMRKFQLWRLTGWLGAAGAWLGIGMLCGWLGWVG